ncbi:unnamed protein product [Camellia sinensis]
MEKKKQRQTAAKDWRRPNKSGWKRRWRQRQGLPGAGLGRRAATSRRRDRQQWCEKKLTKVIVPDKWKAGASNTTEGGGRKINENKLLSKKNRYKWESLVSKRKYTNSWIEIALGFRNLCTRQLPADNQSIHTLPKELNGIVNSICDSLRKGFNWDALSRRYSSVELSNSVVEKVLLQLKEPRDAKCTLGFFHWSAQQKHFKHEISSYCI